MPVVGGYLIGKVLCLNVLHIGLDDCQGMLGRHVTVLRVETLFILEGIDRVPD